MILLSDGRRACESGSSGLLFTTPPRSNAIAAALLGGAIVALAVLLALALCGGKRKSIARRG